MGAGSWIALVTKEIGANFTISPILQSLEPFRKHLTIVSGLRNKARRKRPNPTLSSSRAG